MEQGIDVSNYQEYVNWLQLADSGRVFGFAKSSEGVTFPDPWIGSNWDGMLRAKLQRGAYHYLDGVTSGTREAYYQLAQVPNWMRGDVPALDVEQDPASARQASVDWQTVMKRELGTPGVVYTSKGFADSAGFGNYPQLADSGLWLAAWSITPGGITLEDVPEPWRTRASGLVAFHQYQADGTCPGVNGSCLLDVFMGTADRIGLYGVR